MVSLVVVGAACSGDDDTATTLELFAADFEPIEIEAPDCDYGGSIKRISADNRLTVRFELCEPDVAFGSKVASPIFGILPTELLDTATDDGAALQDPVGTGPYQLGEWDGGSELRLERFERYWQDRARTGSLIFRWDADPASRLAELEASNADGIDAPPADEYAAIEADPALQLLPRIGINVSYLGFNGDIEPFTDQRVRQAIALGLDREEIVDDAYPAGSAPAVQTYPSSLFGWTPTPVWPDPDPAEARSLLLAADAEGMEVTLAYPDQGSDILPDPRGVVEAVQSQLAAIGVTVELNPMAPEALAAALDAGEVAMFLDGWEAATADVADFLGALFGDADSERFGRDLNDLREAMAAAELGNPDLRYLANETVGAVLVEQTPIVPLAHVNGAAAYRDDVVDTAVVPFGLDAFQPTASPVGAEYFSSMDAGERDTFVWIQASEPESLFCADEIEVDTLRACAQVYESLLRYEIGGGEPVDGVTETWEANEDATIWTFRLQDNIEFHDGSHLDAGDVVRTFAMQWDASNPLHVGEFVGFQTLFGAFLNDNDGGAPR